MKFSKYLMMAGAAAMLTACSSEEPIVGPDQNGNAPEGEVYAYFNIALSDNGGTRASTATAGSAEEYAVKNGKILIFGMKSGVADNITNRVNSTYIAAAELEFVDENGNPVTGTSGFDAKYTKVRAKFEKGTFQTEYATFYGVCVLNYDNSWLPTSADGTVTFKTWAENSDLNGAFVNGKGYVMTNAATFTSSDPRVLSKITTGDGYIEDEAKDLKKIAADFTVQRVAAKVSITSPSNFEYKVKDKEGNDVAKATFNNWALDLTRTTSYPVQNVWYDGEDATKKYSVKDLFSTTSNRYVENGICMWGAGKNYTTAIKNTTYARYTVNGWKGMTTTEQYLRENTMAPDQMSKATCTRIIVEATYTLGTDAAQDLISINNKVYSRTTLQTLVEGSAGTTYKVAIKEGNDFVAGAYNFEDVVTITKTEGGENADAAVYRAAAAEAGVINYTANEVKCYVGGKCFYVAYIKHFGTETDAPTLPTQIYPNQYDERYTGRYGVLRNNWYELNLKGVKGIGLPTIPDPDPNHTPDDSGDRNERNMDVNINILNWAKRSQNVEF
ncbi:MAG: Mfa1 family fimbria major subunit [Muribaculaceae bacterium]|nr:Mfa1 family fimbria major subunit [Muribaculaceae bacterium]